MKAIVCTKYGSPDVLQVQELDKPSPKDNELLIKVIASSVTAADSMMRQGVPKYARLFLGLSKPKNPITGTGIAGKIEEIGKDVNNFKVGDKIFGETGITFGGNAEYVCVAADGVISLIPEKLSYDDVVSICDGPLTSINFLKTLGNIQSGQRVLINGAAGSLGTAAVQLAKHYGANVTGVCSTSNIDLVKSLGADNVIDYTLLDFTKGNIEYDIIYDTVGKSSFPLCKSSLTKNGIYMSPVLSMPLLFKMMWTSMTGRKKAKFSATGMLPPPQLLVLLDEIKDLFVEGKLKSIIDKRYTLENTTEAHRYVDTGHKKGNVIISIEAK